MISNEIKAEIPRNSNLTNYGAFHVIEITQKDKTKFDLNALIEIFPTLSNSLLNAEGKEACYIINTIKNILQILIEHKIDNFLEEFVNLDFISYLFHKISSENVHPFFLKELLKIIKLIFENMPQLIDQFLEMDLSNILLSLMPNKYASKCIIKMIENSEQYRSILVQSQFQKQILQMINNLSQMGSDIKYFYEKYYISILFVIHQYAEFDDSDYDNFLSLFMDNFYSRNEDQTLSQKSYINFLRFSNDSKLIHKFVTNPSIIEYLITYYHKPAYSKVRDDVLEYFAQIIHMFNDYASLFIQPAYLPYISSMFVDKENLVSVSHFIFEICRSSFTNCQIIMNQAIFNKLNFHFANCSIEVKNAIYMIFCLLLDYPHNSQFYQYFSDPNLFDHKVFFDYLDMILQIEGELKNSVLQLFHMLLENIIAGDDQPFLNNLAEHLLSSDFYTVLQICCESDDQEFGNSAKLLVQKIETLE